MAKVSDVLKLPALRRLKVCAGESGLNRRVEHVTVMEVPEIKRWLKGNDLLITSFYSVQQDVEAQCSLIRELADTCCCVAVKTGKYVHELSADVKSTADACGLPLIEIPFEMTYIDVIVNVMNLIFEDEGTSEILGKYVKDILYENYSDEILMMERGRLFGFDLEKNYFAAVNICFRKDYPASDHDKKALRFLCQTLQGLLKESKAVWECYKVKLQNGYLLLLEGETAEGLLQAAERAVTEERIRAHWGEDVEKLVCGIGPADRGLKGIRDTYSLCFKTMHVGRRMNRSQFLFSYRKLEIFCALQELLTNEKSQVFTDVLKGVQSDELLDTVIVYYECGGSLDRTAERMFSHKNTVKYRLNRLQERTGLDLKKPDDSFRLYLAVLALRLGKS